MLHKGNGSWQGLTAQEDESVVLTTGQSLVNREHAWRARGSSRPLEESLLLPGSQVLPLAVGDLCSVGLRDQPLVVPWAGGGDTHKLHAKRYKQGTAFLGAEVCKIHPPTQANLQRTTSTVTIASDTQQRTSSLTRSSWYLSLCKALLQLCPDPGFHVPPHLAQGRRAKRTGLAISNCTLPHHKPLALARHCIV